MTAALAILPAAAHHSVHGTYDDTALVTITGMVSSTQWRNPHAVFVLEVADAVNAPAFWSIEIGAPSSLARLGLSRDFLVEGDRVTLEVWAARNGTRSAYARSISLADGRRIDLPVEVWMEAGI